MGNPKVFRWPEAWELLEPRVQTKATDFDAALAPAGEAVDWGLFDMPSGCVVRPVPGLASPHPHMPGCQWEVVYVWDLGSPRKPSFIPEGHLRVAGGRGTTPSPAAPRPPPPPDLQLHPPSNSARPPNSTRPPPPPALQLLCSPAPRPPPGTCVGGAPPGGGAPKPTPNPFGSRAPTRAPTPPTLNREVVSNADGKLCSINCKATILAESGYDGDVAAISALLRDTPGYQDRLKLVNSSTRGSKRNRKQPAAPHDPSIKQELFGGAQDIRQRIQEEASSSTAPAPAGGGGGGGPPPSPPPRPPPPPPPAGGGGEGGSDDAAPASAGGR